MENQIKMDARKSPAALVEIRKQIVLLHKKGMGLKSRSVWGARQRFSMISSVNNQGKRYWMIIDGVFNADRLIEFMESLAKDAPRKVFLVMDNLKVHHFKPVKAWLDKNKERIEVFYLPNYSPELNPDERLNTDLKHAITTSVPRRTRQGLLKIRQNT